MAKHIKNNDSVAHTWAGMEVQPGVYYQIQPSEEVRWANNSSVLDSISNDTLIVSKTNDSSGHIVDHSEALNFLKSITGVLSGNDLTPIGYVSDRLKVDALISPGSGSAPSINKKLRYDDMNVANGGVARNTTITNSAWVTTYSYTGSGLLFSFLLNTEENKNWYIRFIVDNEEIFTSNGLSMSDLDSETLYDLDTEEGHSDNEGQLGISLSKHDKFIWSCPANFPVRYETGVSIQVKRVSNSSSKKFQAGLVVLTKE